MLQLSSLVHFFEIFILSGKHEVQIYEGIWVVMHLPCILSLHFATGCRDWSFHVLYLHWFILSMDCWLENFLSYDLFHNYDRYWILLYFCVSVVQMAIKSTVRTSSVLIQRNHRWVLEMYYYQLSISVHATGLQRATESLLHFQANCDSIKPASHATGLKEFSNYVLSKIVAILARGTYQMQTFSCKPF